MGFLNLCIRPLTEGQNPFHSPTGSFHCPREGFAEKGSPAPKLLTDPLPLGDPAVLRAHHGDDPAGGMAVRGPLPAGWPHCATSVSPRSWGTAAGPRPHSPVEGGAGAVIDHLAVSLHLQVRLAVVTAIILELVDGLRGHGCQGPGPAGSRVAAGPGKGREWPREGREGGNPGKERSGPGPGRTGSAQRLREAGEGERPGEEGP